MQLTEFTFRLLVLFLPGLICAFLVDALTSHRPRQTPFFLLRALLFGFGSYFLYWVMLHAIALAVRPFGHTLATDVNFLKILGDTATPIAAREVFFVCVCAVALGVLATIEATYKLGHRLSRVLHVTKKFGEIDVWGYTMNARGLDWVTYRDVEKDLIYDGWITAFSDDGEENVELLLRDVSVYRNSTGDHLYNVGLAYLCRERKSITLEFRGGAAGQASRTEAAAPPVKEEEAKDEP